ncbi:hypothetical protein B0H39_005981 [Clostridium beijerinckii]|uniref:hypothetical protein n=1 Tax=Clostridium beijerinckii TaxID=1520 RepID=UPI001494B6CD|nr:hypothetical protein [Clostridium beijerinckii]NOW87950.1 hypothetical protein [Clostridium beijerinckii]
MITTARKQETCEKYDMYLQIIEKLGHRIMLQKQFVQLCLELNVAKNKFEVMAALQELEISEIIKKINFVDSTNKFILFKKYAIKYMTKAKKSSDVTSIRQPNSNRKYYESIFKIHLIIYTIVPFMQKKNIEINLKSLLNFIEEVNCNILYTKNQGKKFYDEQLIKFHEFINIAEYEKSCELLDKIETIRMQNLNKIAKKGDLTERKKREDYLNYSTVDTLLKKDIYIKHIKKAKKKEKIIISCCYFDLDNTQKAATITLNIAIAYKLFSRIFDVEIELKMDIITFNSIAEENVKKELYKRGVNPKTRRMRIDNYLNETLRADGLTEIDFDKIEIGIKNFGIEENYQNNTKIRN